ncbi:MAG: hypothetical protein JSS50_02730 [Proteobacteria bacterium]|nr:hypothetical protein [Pseudomonadota bacterium]
MNQKVTHSYVAKLEASSFVQRINMALQMGLFQLSRIAPAELENSSEALDEVKREMRYNVFLACTRGIPCGLDLKLPKPHAEQTEKVYFIEHKFGEKLGEAMGKGASTETWNKAAGEVQNSELGKQYLALNRKAQELENAIDDCFSEMVEMMKNEGHRAKYSALKTRANLIMAGAAVGSLAITVGAIIGMWVNINEYSHISAAAAFKDLFEHSTGQSVFTGVCIVSLLTLIGLYTTASAGMIGFGIDEMPGVHHRAAQQMLDLIGPKAIEKALQKESAIEMLVVVEDAVQNKVNNISKMRVIAKELQHNIEEYAKSRATEQVRS